MQNPVKVAAALGVLAIQTPSYAVEYARYRKERRARVRKYEAEEARIQASRDHIGPHVHVPCPVQIWA